jgi:hypothetical protein
LYFNTVDACIDREATLSPDFFFVFSVAKTCRGGTIRTVDDLNGLWYCDTIQGGLVIEVEDAGADFTALRYISTINGLSSLH